MNHTQKILYTFKKTGNEVDVNFYYNIRGKVSNNPIKYFHSLKANTNSFIKIR